MCRHRDLFVLLVGLLGGVLLVGGENPPADADCLNAEPFPDPSDCTYYYQCFDVGGGKWYLVRLACAKGGYFNATGNVCIEGTCLDSESQKVDVVGTIIDKERSDTSSGIKTSAQFFIASIFIVDLLAYVYF